MSTSELRQALERYGANMDEAMERFMDDEELYADCLQIFMNDDNFSALSDALDAGDHRRAFDAAHTLKGVSGNLGLTPLYDAICELVERLRAKQYDGLDVYHDKLRAQMALLRTTIGAKE